MIAHCLWWRGSSDIGQVKQWIGERPLRPIRLAKKLLDRTR